MFGVEIGGRIRDNIDVTIIKLGCRRMNYFMFEMKILLIL